MKHTLESLLALAETDDGRKQIRVIVAELAGWAGVLNDPLHGYVGIKPGEWASRKLPHFHTSLDAIMPEVRKLSIHDGDEWPYIQRLTRVLHAATKRPASPFKLATAEAVHHCIAFILTKQP